MGKRLRSPSTSPPGNKPPSAPQRPISPPPLRRKHSSIPTAPTVPDTSQEVEQRFEILSWNVNGASKFLKTETPKITSYFTPPKPSQSTTNPDPDSNSGHSSLRQVLKRHNWPQMLCLQEVKINLHDTSTKAGLEKAANSSFSKVTDEGPQYTAFYSLPRDKHNATGWGGKVHGVCTLIRTPLTTSSTTTDVDWDLEGRVLHTRFAAWKLAIVNAYWVNGTSAPYRNPGSGELVGTRHDWKRAFHAHMLADVKTLEREGWSVVLVGDMNIAPQSIDGYPNLRLGAEHVRNRRDFNMKFLAWDLKGEEDGEGMRGIDTFRHFHGGERKFTYHGEKAVEWGRSCDRVDLGIVSRGLIEGEANRGAVVGAEIWETLEERGGSDHVPLSVVLDVGKLCDKSDEKNIRES